MVLVLDPSSPRHNMSAPARNKDTFYILRWHPQDVIVLQGETLTGDFIVLGAQNSYMFLRTDFLDPFDRGMKAIARR